MDMQLPDAGTATIVQPKPAQPVVAQQDANADEEAELAAMMQM